MKLKTSPNGAPGPRNATVRRDAFERLGGLLPRFY